MEINSEALQQTGKLIEYENATKECYFSIFSSSHENLTIRDSGLIINPNYPYIGASPDAIVECKCCGIRCLEIKCPYCHCLEVGGSISCYNPSSHSILFSF